MRRLRPPTLRTTEAPRAAARPSVASDSTGLLAGAVASSQMALTQEVSYTASTFTTTNTADWQSLLTFNILIPPGNAAFYTWATTTPKHSAATAEVSTRIAVFTDDTLTTAYVVCEAANIYMHTADKYISPVILTTGHNVPSNMPLLIPGVRTVIIQAFNHTTGTLTIAGGTNRFILHALVAGDAS